MLWSAEWTLSVAAQLCQGQRWHFQRHPPGPWEDRSDQISHDTTWLYSLKGENMYDEVHQHLKQRLDLDVIRPSRSPWTSNVVLVQKPNWELRLCIDYKWINQCSVADAYYFPRIDKTLDTLAGVKYLASLDLKSRYCQVEMREDAKQYTAFTVGPLGFYECNHMPFGLKKRPGDLTKIYARGI